MKLFTTKTDIKAAIEDIRVTGQKLDQMIWVAVVSAMSKHNEDGDVTLVNALVDAMPQGSRVNALREFITAFGKVTYDAENKVFQHDKKGNFDLDGALSKSWVEFKPEQPYKPLDTLALIKALATKVQNADRSKGDKCTKAQAIAVLKLATELGVELPAAKEAAAPTAKAVQADPLAAAPVTA